MFPEQYQTPRHLLLAYRTYWAITGRRSCAPLTLCGLRISKGDVQLLCCLLHSLSLLGNSYITACSSTLQVTEKVQVSFLCVPLDCFASHLDL